MPTRWNRDDRPVVQFDPRIEVSPFLLFRRLKAGQAPPLIDVRSRPGRRSLEGARPYPGDDWLPEPGEEPILFDEDGSEALAVVERLQAGGCEGARMLFGGLDLYEFSLDPEVVGARTFLVTRGD